MKVFWSLLVGALMFVSGTTHAAGLQQGAHAIGRASLMGNWHEDAPPPAVGGGDIAFAKDGTFQACATRDRKTYTSASGTWTFDGTWLDYHYTKVSTGAMHGSVNDRDKVIGVTALTIQLLNSRGKTVQYKRTRTLACPTVSPAH